MLLGSPEALAPNPCLFWHTARPSQQLLLRCVHDFHQPGVVPWDDLPLSSEVSNCSREFQLVLHRDLMLLPLPGVFDPSLNLLLRLPAHLHHTYTGVSCYLLHVHCTWMPGHSWRSRAILSAHIAHISSRAFSCHSTHWIPCGTRHLSSS